MNTSLICFVEVTNIIGGIITAKGFGYTHVFSGKTHGFIRESYNNILLGEEVECSDIGCIYILHIDTLNNSKRLIEIEDFLKNAIPDRIVEDINNLPMSELIHKSYYIDPRLFS